MMTAQHVLAAAAICCCGRAGIAGETRTPQHGLTELKQLEDQLREMESSGRTPAQRGAARAAIARRAEELAKEHPNTCVATDALMMVAAHWHWRAQHPEQYPGRAGTAQERDDCLRQAASWWSAATKAGEGAHAKGEQSADLPTLIAIAYCMLSICQRDLGDSEQALATVTSLVDKHQDEPAAQVRGRHNRFRLLCALGRKQEALNDLRALCERKDAYSRVEGHLLAVTYYTRHVDPPDFELAAQECRQAVTCCEGGTAPKESIFAFQDLVDRVSSVERLALRAEPRARTAGLITILPGTDRSFQYLSTARQQEGRAAWEERVRRLTARGALQRDTHDAITLEPEGPDPQQTDTARTTAAVSVKPVDGPATAGALRCTFVREERIWRLQDLELVTQERR